mgnify:CR=1 FL=1
MAGILDFITSKDPESVERRLRLAQGLGGMTTNPNVGLQNSIQGRLEGIQKTRATTASSDKLASQSAMAIKILGAKFPMLTQALQAGIISPNDAITAARKGSDVKVVGKSLVDREGNVLFTSEDAGSGSTTAFDTLKLRAKDAGLKEGTPQYQQFMIQGGANKGMTLTSDGKGGFTMTQGGATIAKPKTEGQANATGFWQRVKIANDNLEGLEGQGTKFGANLLSALPFGVGNMAQTPEFQLYSQSQEDWINAVLRDESGAAIGPDEFVSAKTQYFPQVGDGPEVIAQKRANRKTKELGLWTKSGQDTPYPTGYNPPALGGKSGKTIKTYDAQGNLISG